jgi:predicted nucleotidyltransferase
MNPLVHSGEPLSPVTHALEALRSGLAGIYGERLCHVVLFGSVARGTADPTNSDVDVLVVLNGDVKPGAEIGRTGQLVADISLDHDCVISCLFMKEEEFLHRQGPLLRNIRREGVPV